MAQGNASQGVDEMKDLFDTIGSLRDIIHTTLPERIAGPAKERRKRDKSFRTLERMDVVLQRLLDHHVGIENAIEYHRLAEELGMFEGENNKHVRLRGIVLFLIDRGHPVCSTTDNAKHRTAGVFYAKNVEEIETCARYWLSLAAGSIDSAEALMKTKHSLYHLNPHDDDDEY
jgi:hypothetical protein